MLCYCRATQDYANETENQTDSAVWINRGFATLNETDYSAPSDKKVENDCENKRVQWKSAALVLKNNVAVRFRFTSLSAENLKAVITVHGKDTTLTNIKADGNAYYIDFNGLYVSHFPDTMTVRIFDGDTQISNTLTYSVYSYAKSKSQVGGNLGRLVDSIMNYGFAAAEYNNK